MIAMRGADAVNVVMNALALLFALDLDNFIFDMLINEGTKAKFAEAGHLTVGAADAERLERAKMVYVLLTSVLTALCIQLLVILRSTNGLYWYFLLFIFGPVSGVLELWAGGSHGSVGLRGLAEVLAKSAVGCAVIALSFLVQAYP